MLTFAVEHKRQLRELTSDLTNDLRAYELSQEEWKLAEELRDTLKVNKYLVLTHCPSSHPLQILKDATEFFSQGSPSLPSVIPAMDHIDAAFTKSIRSTRNVNPAIRAAITTAKKTLNRYYSRTDDVEVYRIAMSKFFYLFLSYNSS
jgi:hypothetical protein